MTTPIKRIIRYDEHGTKSFQLVITHPREDIIWRVGFDLELSYVVSDWLKENCVGKVDHYPGYHDYGIRFYDERDAVLFLTFHA